MISSLQKKAKRKSRLGKIALAVFSGLVFFPSMAQTTIQVGTGTGTTGNTPIYAYFGYSYSQQIYTASEIQSAGASGPQEVSAIRFYFDNGDNSNSNNWTVYMANSSKVSFDSNSDWADASQMQNVFSGTVNMLGGGNWIEVILSTPFQWDGNSNIIVAIDENQSGYSSWPGGNWQKSDLGANRSIYVSSDWTNFDPLSPPSASGRNGYVPNIQFEMTPAPDCSGAPAVANILSSNGFSLCDGDETVLSIDNAPFENGITYQWQSYNGTTWDDLVGDTSASMSTGTLSTTTEYQLVVGCSISGMSTPTNSEIVTVNPLPTVIVDLPDAAICDGGSATINASGADTYSWTPSTGLSATTGASVTATPGGTVEYTVEGTDANGCVNTATSLITPVSELATQVTVSPGEICSPGSTVTATIGTLPTLAGGGSWNFRFLDEDGTTELQTWSANSDYSFIPSQDSNYVIYAQAQATSCPSPLDSVMFDIAVGFGADVTVEDYNCINMGGVIELSNIFGQADYTNVYTNAFDATSNMSAVTLTGSAAIANDRLEVTPSQTSMVGYAEIDVPTLALGVNNSFDISFDLTTDLPINNWGTGGADGIAYSFGDDASQSSNGNGHNGQGTKLRLSFDAAGNSSENGNQPGIYLVYGWTASNAFGPGSTETIAYSSNTSAWKGLTDVPVQFSINSNGNASLWVNGTLIFDNVQMPSAYAQADVTGWKQLFSARTGGDAERHAVSNFEMNVNSMVYALETGSSTTIPTTWQGETTFTGLAPGTYHVWIAKDPSAACGKNIQTVEILNANPIVDLGNDTTICNGTALTLDAGNAGSTYTWSNTNDVTQTIQVSDAGSYVAYVTDTLGCLGIGTINVDVMYAPSASGIYTSGNYPTHTFSVMNPVSATTYDWDFGDGTTATNAPSTVDHTYWQTGLVAVEVTMTNICGSTSITEPVNLINTVSVPELGEDLLGIYPNPATTSFNVVVEGVSDVQLKVVSITGATVLEQTTFDGSYLVETSTWSPGIYIVDVMFDDRQLKKRVVVK